MGDDAKKVSYKTDVYGLSRPQVGGGGFEYSVTVTTKHLIDHGWSPTKQTAWRDALKARNNLGTESWSHTDYAAADVVIDGEVRHQWSVWRVEQEEVAWGRDYATITEARELAESAEAAIRKQHGIVT